MAGLTPPNQTITSKQLTFKYIERMKNTVIGRARCPHCGYITSTGGITEHIKHCSKNPDVIAKKRQKVVPTEVSFDSLPKHLQDFLALPIESPTSTAGAAAGEILYPLELQTLVLDYVAWLESMIPNVKKSLHPQIIQKIKELGEYKFTPPTAHTEELSREGRSMDKELIQFLISSDKPFKIIEVRNIIKEYDREEISLSRFAEKLNEIAFYWNKKSMEHCFNESRLQFKHDNSFCHETFNDYLIYKNK